MSGYRPGPVGSLPPQFPAGLLDVFRRKTFYFQRMIEMMRGNAELSRRLSENAIFVPIEICKLLIYK